MPDWL